MEIGNLPKKVFRIMIVKMIQELGKEWKHRVGLYKNFKQRLKNIKNKQRWKIQYLKYTKKESIAE